MPLDLPAPIDLFVRLDNSGDTEALGECFAPNATVRDEGHTHAGLAAIREWVADTKKRYHHTITPLEVVRRDSKTVLKARLAGTFPGSPVIVEFNFVLADGKIASLEIH